MFKEQIRRVCKTEKEKEKTLQDELRLSGMLRFKKRLKKKEILGENSKKIKERTSEAKSAN